MAQHSAVASCVRVCCLRIVSGSLKAFLTLLSDAMRLQPGVYTENKNFIERGSSNQYIPLVSAVTADLN